jgi:hypothetical protein
MFIEFAPLFRGHAMPTDCLTKPPSDTRLAVLSPWQTYLAVLFFSLYSLPHAIFLPK